MQDAILVIAVLSAIVFGFFIMRRLDDFLEKNRKASENEEHEKTSFCITLDGKNDEELLSEIRSFKRKFPNAKVVIYDSKNKDITETIERYKK